MLIEEKQSTESKAIDAEMNALRIIYYELREFSQKDRDRILNWVMNRLNKEHKNVD